MDVPAIVVERYLSEHDDGADLKGSLQLFREQFENESDVELERKRGIMRARILTKYPDDDKEKKLAILTEIIQGNVRRRATFEQQKELSRWIQTGLGAVAGFLGGLLAG